MKFRKWLLASVGCGLVAATGCGGSTDPASHDHGRIVAQLPILFAARPAFFAEHGTIHVAVAVGQRFSIKVDTSDGPYFWNEAGRPPNSRLVKLVGDFNDGHCAADLLGCRVPYFHTLLAQDSGTTTMTWRYHNVSCPSGQGRPSKATARCTRIGTVVFDITIH